jgi:hypothetical protein
MGQFSMTISADAGSVLSDNQQHGRNNPVGIKSKVRSMQRGALHRVDETPVTNADLYRQSPPLLTDDELVHFRFGNRSINDFFEGLSDILQACHHNRLAAGDVANVLNKKQLRTACGESWTPRLAWFLMKTWRTVYFQKQALARQRKNDPNQVENPRAVKNEKEEVVDRAAQRQQSFSFQRILKDYFKNPTFGEVFPELGALKQALLSQEQDFQAGKPEMKADVRKKSHSVLKQNAHKEKGRVRKKTRKTPLHIETNAASIAEVPLNDVWKQFLDSGNGRKYLVELVRSNQRLLLLAPQKDAPFLGCLRSRKAVHPAGKYWTSSDAEQVRIAILAGLHKEDQSN